MKCPKDPPDVLTVKNVEAALKRGNVSNSSGMWGILWNRSTVVATANINIDTLDCTISSKAQFEVS